jgi:hypothetical protein
MTDRYMLLESLLTSQNIHSVSASNNSYFGQEHRVSTPPPKLAQLYTCQLSCRCLPLCHTLALLVANTRPFNALGGATNAGQLVSGLCAGDNADALVSQVCAAACMLSSTLLTMSTRTSHGADT